MVKIEDECLGCPPELGCAGDRCKNRNVPRFYCDECEEEFEPEELYDYDGQMLCADCLLLKYKTVAQIGVYKYIED